MGKGVAVGGSVMSVRGCRAPPPRAPPRGGARSSPGGAAARARGPGRLRGHAPTSPQVEVAGIEAGQGGESVEVADPDPSVAELDEPRLAQFGQDAADVNHGAADGGAEVILGDRQGVALGRRKVDRLQSVQQLDEQVGDALVDPPPAQVDEPLAQHRLLDERRPGEG